MTQAVAATKTNTQRMYDLADFLGINLKIEKGYVAGKGSLNLDMGLLRYPMMAQVFSSHTDSTTSECILLVAGPGDLGLLCVYDPLQQLVDLIVLDRSALPKRGKALFETANPPITDSVAAFKLVEDGYAEYFVGNIRGPFTKASLASGAATR